MELEIMNQVSLARLTSRALAPNCSAASFALKRSAACQRASTPRRWRSSSNMCRCKNDDPLARLWLDLARLLPWRRLGCCFPNTAGNGVAGRCRHHHRQHQMEETKPMTDNDKRVLNMLVTVIAIGLLVFVLAVALRPARAMSPSDQLAQNILDTAHTIGILFWLFVAGILAWGVGAAIFHGILFPIYRALQRRDVQVFLVVIGLLILAVIAQRPARAADGPFSVRAACEVDNSGPECGDQRDAMPPKPVRFQPWQEVWQCNDLRVTVTGPAPGTVNYDIAGSIWGGINFTFDGPRHQLYKGQWPCAFVR